MVSVRHPDKGKSRPDDESGFLSRWSQRKQQHRVSETGQPTVPETAEPLAASDTPVVTDTPDAPNQHLDASPGALPESAPEPAAAEDTAEEEVLLRDEDMPPLETLQKDSDVSMFFNRGVSADLRKAALRKLFHLPALNITDGLNDYDEDYTTFEPLGDIVTADMRYHAERKAKLAEEEEAARAQLDAADESRTTEDSDDVGAAEQVDGDELPTDDDEADSTDKDQQPESHTGESTHAEPPTAHANPQSVDPEQATTTNARRHSLIDDPGRDRGEVEGKLSRHE